MKFCPECGKPIEHNAVFCGGCGKALPEEVLSAGQPTQPVQPNPVLPPPYTTSTAPAQAQVSAANVVSVVIRVIAVVVLLCVFMPFATISCSGQELVTVSGIELGLAWTDAEAVELLQESVLIGALAIVPAIAAVISLAIPKFARIGGIFGVISLWAFMQISSSIFNPANASGLGGLIIASFDISFESGLFYSIVGSIALTIAGWCYWPNKERSPT